MQIIKTWYISIVFVSGLNMYLRQRVRLDRIFPGTLSRIVSNKVVYVNIRQWLYFSSLCRSLNVSLTYLCHTFRSFSACVRDLIY